MVRVSHFLFIQFHSISETIFTFINPKLKLTHAHISASAADRAVDAAKLWLSYEKSFTFSPIILIRNPSPIGRLSLVDYEWFGTRRVKHNSNVGDIERFAWNQSHEEELIFLWRHLHQQTDAGTKTWLASVRSRRRNAANRDAIDRNVHKWRPCVTW